MTDRRPLIIGAILVLLLGFAFQHYALAPKHDRVAELDEQIATADQALAKAKADLAAGQAAKAAYDRNYAIVTRLGRAVPDGVDAPSLVYQLDTAARQAGVDFMSVALSGSGAATPADTTASTSAASGVTDVPLTLTFRGSYFELNAFLMRINRLVRVSGDRIDVRGRLVDVQKIDLKPTGSSFTRIEASITAMAYTQPAGVTATTPAATGGTVTDATPVATPTPSSSAPTTTASTTTTTDR